MIADIKSANHCRIARRNAKLLNEMRGLCCLADVRSKCFLLLWILGVMFDRVCSGFWLLVSSKCPRRIPSCFVRVRRGWLCFVDLAVTVVMGTECRGKRSCFKIAGVRLDYQITGPKEVVLAKQLGRDRNRNRDKKRRYEVKI